MSMSKTDHFNQFFQIFEKSILKNYFVKATVGKYKGQEKDLQKIYIRLVEIGEESMLSFNYKFTTKDYVKNFSIKDGLSIIRESMGKDFLSAHLYTLKNDHQLVTNRRRQFKMFTSLPTNDQIQSKVHNKVKNRMIGEEQSYLHHLGITTKEGKVKSDKNDKFRQINKFIEIIDGVFKSSDAFLKNDLKVVDMGSGKSYLTFALYDYFTNNIKTSTKVVGFEQRTELIDFSNNLAQECHFNRLYFNEGSIKDANINGADMLVALHACDTATDDALFQAIKEKVGVIIVSPCCQHYVRQIMNEPDVMKSITKNGILKERLSVMLTDTFRALTLEAFGYKTKVFEFISSEHTDKNIMISAVLNSNAKFNPKKMEEINQLKVEFGIKDYYLDNLLFE